MRNETTRRGGLRAVLRATAATGVLLLAAGIASADGTAGSIDTSFGTNGTVVIDDHRGSPVSVAVEPDGDIVVVAQSRSGYFLDGRETEQWTIRRYLADGSVDASFGSGGVVHYGGLGLSEYPGDVGIDSQGRIVVGGNGSVEVVSGKGKKQQISRQRGGMVIRLESDGDLDPTFGDGGQVYLGDAGLGFVRALVVLPDDSVVVGGGTEAQLDSGGGGKGKGNKGGGGGNTTGALYLAALTEDGEIDTTFGDQGVTIYNLAEGEFLGDERMMPGGISRQSTGDLLVAANDLSGTATSAWNILRFTASGDFDAGFGPVVDTTAGLYGIEVAPDDSVYGVGYVQADGDFLLAKYDEDGTPDTSFGSSGRVTIDASVGFRAVAAYDMHLDGSGLVVGGYIEDATSGNFSMCAVRFESDGDLDATYGANGFSETIEGAVGSFTALTPGGDVVLLGQEDPRDLPSGEFPAWILTVISGS